MSLLSKSQFLEYLNCPGWAWLQLNEYQRSQEYSHSGSALVGRQQMGRELEKYANKLFPDGQSGLVAEHDHRVNQEKTKSLIEAGQTVIFQGTFTTASELLVIVDIIQRDPTDPKSWWLYEVKSTTKVDPVKHIPDLAFQSLVLAESGLKISCWRILHLNKDYLFQREIDPQKLFLNEGQYFGVDVSQEVRDCLKGQSDLNHLNQPLSRVVRQAKEVLDSAKPADCDCRLKTRRNQCPAVDYFHPGIMADDKIYAIRRLLPKQLAIFLKAGVDNFSQISKDLLANNLNENQRQQVELHPDTQKVQSLAIRKQLDELEKPIYFFDYETFSEAIPVIANSGPYWALPFLFSLYRLEEPDGGEPKRLPDYLMEAMNPEQLGQLVEELKSGLGPTGRIVSWNASFEKSVNKRMAILFPKEAGFFENINQRLYDLEKIFSGGLYLDGRLAGKTSVKKVTAVLVPELSYENPALKIKKGDEATTSWLNAINSPDPKFRQETFANLKEYCRQDSFVMAKILQLLYRAQV